MSTTNPAPAQAAATAATVVAVTAITNGHIVVTFRANGDPTTDRKVTLMLGYDVKIDSPTLAADVQAWLAQEKERVARDYMAASLAQGTLLDAIPLG